MRNCPRKISEFVEAPEGLRPELSTFGSGYHCPPCPSPISIVLAVVGDVVVVEYAVAVADGFDACVVAASAVVVASAAVAASSAGVSSAVML